MNAPGLVMKLTGPLACGPLPVRSATRPAVLVKQLDVHEPRLVVYGVAVNVVEEVVLALRNDLARELSVTGDAPFDYLIERLQYGPLSVPVHQLGDAVFGETAGGHEGARVAFQHLREPAVVEDEPRMPPGDLAFAHDPDWRHQHPLVKYLRGVRRQAARDAPADVPEVPIAHREPDGTLLVEHGRGEAHVPRCAG